MYQDGRHMLVGGPYLPGIWNDNMIFNDGLVHYLEVGERCEADDGYRGSAPVYAKCPAVDFVGPDEVAMKQRVRNRQETVNKRFKNWAILASPYRHQLPITNKFLVLWQFSPSFRWQKTLCFR
jgi:hypothetical protein